VNGIAITGPAKGEAGVVYLGVQPAQRVEAEAGEQRVGAFFAGGAHDEGAAQSRVVRVDAGDQGEQGVPLVGRVAGGDGSVEQSVQALVGEVVRVACSGWCLGRLGHGLLPRCRLRIEQRIGGCDADALRYVMLTLQD
jgi:hypothetical protein